MKIKFLGATGTVTGSKYLITTEQSHLLVDCGLFQGYKNLRERNREPFAFDVASIDAVALTHAHLDHSGMIPLLYKNGYRSPVYCSQATFELCKLLLPDSGYLQEEEARFRNKHKLTRHEPALPLYDLKDAKASLSLFRPVEFSETVVVKDLTLSFDSVGHILGASRISLSDGHKKVIVSGDVGRTNDPVMYPPKPLADCDVLLLESTYGNRLHDPAKTEETLAQIVNDTAANGGSILIPSFAIGRAQSLTFVLSELIKTKKIPKLPIFLDSPMAISASDIYCRFNREHRLSDQQCEQMCELVEYTKEVEQSKQLAKIKYPHIIISASGMATGGRVLHHLNRFLPDHKNTVVFAGYQAGGTRGQKLVNGHSSVKIFGREVGVQANIRELTGFSAHADYQEMIDWIKNSNISEPKRTFIVHGEADASDEFRLHLRDQLGWQAVVPDYKNEYKI